MFKAGLKVSRFNRDRARRGSTIAELAPALLVLFIIILFPMIDIIYLGLGYCAGWYLNQMTLRACSTVEPAAVPATAADYVTATNNMNTAWLGNGLASMTGGVVVSNVATPKNFGSTVDNQTGAPMQYIQVDTQVQINPFVSLGSVPFLSALNIDGLTKPIIFNYTDKRPLEETGLN